MKRHFVTFYSPGAFMAENSIQEIDSWDVSLAKIMAGKIKERYGAIPYGFRFTTCGRLDNELDSKVIATSPMYYINCGVRTLEEIEARNDPKDKTLIWNMKTNKWNRVVYTLEGWSWTQPLEKDDVVL